MNIFIDKERGECLSAVLALERRDFAVEADGELDVDSRDLPRVPKRQPPIRHLGLPHLPSPTISRHRPSPVTDHLPSPTISHHRPSPITDHLPSPAISHHRSPSITDHRYLTSPRAGYEW